MNAKISEFLNLLASETNGYKKIALQRGATIIGSLDYKVTKDNYLDLLDITGIGKGIIERLEMYFKKPNAKTHERKLTELMTVMGIGPSAAEDIYKKYKITTVKELKSSKIPLTRMQKLGLKYYDDLHTPITRSEIQSIAKKIDKIFKRKSIICGSYRRGKEYSNDVDLLYVSSHLLNFDVLQTQKWFVDIISGGERYSILILHDGLVRQVDLFNCTRAEYPTFVFYLTGSAAHNTVIRRLAKHLGYTLNQYGLFKGTKEIVLRDEHDIYKKLGESWVAPENR